MTLVVIAIASSSCSTWWTTGSVVRTKHVHVGVRPASDGIGDYAMTIQVTTDAMEGPWQ